MIKLIHGYERNQFPAEIDAMHRIRKRVFCDRLGWAVPTINTWEIDGYDAMNVLYLVCIDDAGRVVGSLRLLPTMSFNMLNDTFPELLPEGHRVESPLIWESSRFSLDHEADRTVGPGGVSLATAELIIGMNEVGRRAGLTHVVTVYDAFVGRILRRANCRGDLISEPKRIGKVMAYAGLFEVGEEMDAALREASGIRDDVIEEASAVRTGLMAA